MNEKEKLELPKKYMEMSDEELSEMLSINESEYEDGVYELLLDVAKSRGFGETKEEIIAKASSLQQFFKENIASQPLTPKQQMIFTLLPGLAFWYSIFAPKEWRQRLKEAYRCQLIGLRNYLILGLICGIFLIFSLNDNQNLILICIWSIFAIVGISIYLHFKHK